MTNANQGQGINMQDKLKSMNRLYSGAKDKAPGVTDGSYTLQLQSCKLDQSKSSGNLMVVRDHYVVEGEFAGEVLRDYIVLSDDRGMYALAQFLRQMGYEAPDNLEDVSAILTELDSNNPVYVGMARRSGDSDIYNVKITEVTQSSAAKASAPTAEPAAAKPASAPAPKQSAAPAAVGVNVGAIVTFDGGEDGTITGTVATLIDAATASVKQNDEAGTVWTVDIADLTIAAAPPPAKAAKKASKPTAADPKLAALKTLGASYGVDELADGQSLEEVITIMSTYTWDEVEMLPEEVALVKECGIPSIPAPKAPKKAAKK